MEQWLPPRILEFLRGNHLHLEGAKETMAEVAFRMGAETWRSGTGM